MNPSSAAGNEQSGALRAVIALSILVPLAVWALGTRSLWVSPLLIAFALAGAGGWLLVRFWPDAAVISLCACAYLSRYRFEAGPVSIRIEHVAVLGLAAVVAFRFAASRERPRLTVPGLYALGWWLALALSAFLHAPDFTDTIRHLVRLAILCTAYLVTVNLSRTRASGCRCFGWLYAFGMLEAVYGILARYLYLAGLGAPWLFGKVVSSPLNLGVQTTSALPVPVPYGTMEEGNIFGSTMAALFAASIALLFQPARGISRAMAAAGGLLSGFALLLSLARGAWAAALFVLPILWVAGPNSRQKRLAHLKMLVIIAPIGCLLVLSTFWLSSLRLPVLSRVQSLTHLADDPTTKLRIKDWYQASSYVALRPVLGWGPGTFEQLHGLRYGRPAWITSLILKNAQEGGFLGLIFLLGMWWTLLARGARDSLEEPAHPERGALLALTAGLAVLFVAYQATDATWLAFQWVWMGCLASTQSEVCR